MMSRDELMQLKRFIWPPSAVRPVRIYAVLDCARDPAIYNLAARSYREKSCLFAGNLDAELERNAPLLLELQQGDGLTDQLLSSGWRQAWLILVQSESSFRTLRRHLRTFLRVQTEGGRFLLFRYYDPRVLTAYLPTCNSAELLTIFGDHIKQIFCFAPRKFGTVGYRFSGDELHETVCEPVRT